MGRASSKLSVKFTEKPDLKPGLYGDGNGLYLQVSNRKTKSWVFRYMIASRARKMGLGDFERVSLKDARKKANAAHGLVVDGVDPIEHRNVRKAAQAVEKAKFITFKEATQRYIEAHQAGWKSSTHANQWTASLETYAFPKIGQLPVGAIDTALVLQVLEQKIDGERFWNCKTETASRVRGRIETVLSWSKARGYREGENPAQWRGHLDQLLPAKSQVKPVRHHPALPYRDLPDFMAKLRQRKGVTARALEFTILTIARTGDTIGAKWSEIDKQEKLWTVPAGRVKGKKGARKRDHAVPLPARAFEILEDLPREGDFIFPGDKEGRGLTNMVMANLLDRMGYPAALATVHGFRSTFKDWVSEQTAYPNELSEMAMAHTVSDKVEAAYRRGDMREKRRRLMDDWATFCAGNAVGGDNVIPMQKAS
jgi:integrase